MDQDREQALTLELLEAIEARSDVTQRHLADRLGVALGLANSYLRRCVRKGLIKIHQAPANRYLYYLTPKGFAEKSRLTAQYLSASFGFYRKASESMIAALTACDELGRRRVLLAGASELAEIASVRALDFELDLLGTWDPGYRGARFIGRPVWQRLEDVPPADACIWCALIRPRDWLEDLTARFGAERLIVPGIVRPVVAAQPPEGEEEIGMSKGPAAAAGPLPPPSGRRREPRP